MRHTRNGIVAAVVLFVVFVVVVTLLITHDSSTDPQQHGSAGKAAAAGTPTVRGQRGVNARPEVADVRAGIVAYADNQGKGAGAPNIQIGKAVRVLCVAPNASGITSINAFYLLDTPPWRGLFASANQFANGAKVGVTTNSDPLDPRVAKCRGG